MADTKSSDSKALDRQRSMEARSSKDQLRKIANQNIREREQCAARTSALEREKRLLRAQLSKEEQQLRAQLERLELEKQSLEGASAGLSDGESPHAILAII